MRNANEIYPISQFEYMTDFYLKIGLKVRLIRDSDGKTMDLEYDKFSGPSIHYFMIDEKPRPERCFVCKEDPDPKKHYGYSADFIASNTMFYTSFQIL